MDKDVIEGARPWSRRGRVALAGLTSLAVVGAVGAIGAAPAAAVGPGSLLAWGFNNQGQLGDGTTTFRDIPVDVDLPAGVTITDVEGASFAHSLAITSDGGLLAWGNNNQGQLGDGTHTDRHAPVAVDLSILAPGETIVEIAGGQDHSFAVTSDGRGLAWGNNAWGNLGDGTTTSSDEPVEIALPVGETLVDIASGYNHGLGLTADGDVLAWGYNGVGSLGDGTNVTRHLPGYVDLSVLDPGETVTDIASMTHHNLALTSAGRIASWGDNQWGQLGDGTTTQRRTPVLVDIPAGVTITAIGVGWDNSLAVTSTGAGLAWGTDDLGQNGDGGPTPVVQTSIVNIDLPAGVQLAAVDGGIDHSVALTTDGRVLGFGYGGSGQMGNGTTFGVNASPVFATLPPLTTVHDIDAGVYHNLAVADVNQEPTATITTPADGAVVEYGSTVLADYACADLEAITSCVGDVADGAAIDTTSSLGAKTFSVTATDSSGATTTVTNDYTLVDTTDPTVTITSPIDGAQFFTGQVVAADFACSDLLLASCVGPVVDGAPIDTAAAGVKTFTVTGTDTSGNEASSTVSYTVKDRTVLTTDAAIVRVGPGLGLNFSFSARLTTTTGAPIAGEPISFAYGPGNPVCSAVTNANGVATCGNFLQGVLSVLSLGYQAGYAGDELRLPAAAKGPFVILLGISLF